VRVEERKGWKGRGDRTNSKKFRSSPSLLVRGGFTFFFFIFLSSFCSFYTSVVLLRAAVRPAFLSVRSFNAEGRVQKRDSLRSVSPRERWSGALSPSVLIHTERNCLALSFFFLFHNRFCNLGGLQSGMRVWALTHSFCCQSTLFFRSKGT